MVLSLIIRQTRLLFFHGRACIAYTGIAMIGSQRTDEWITNHLVNQPNLQQAVNHLKDALDKEIPRLRAPNKHLSVVIDWWGMPAPDSPYTPSSTILTNAYDPVTKDISKRPQISFLLNTHTLPEGKDYAFIPYGQNLDFIRYGQNLKSDVYEKMVKRLYRAARRVSKNSTIVEPNVLCRFMEEAVLKVASKNLFVGNNLMTTVLYNPLLVENQGKLNAFSYRHGDKSDRIMYAPTIISPSMTIMGFHIYPGPSRFDIK